MMITKEEQLELQKKIKLLRDSQSKDHFKIQQWDLIYDEPRIDELANMDEDFYRDFIQIFEYQDYFLNSGIQSLYGYYDRGVFNFIINILSGKKAIKDSTDIHYDFIEPMEDMIKYLFSVLIFVTNNKKEIFNFISNLYTNYWEDDPFPEGITKEEYIDIVICELYKNTDMGLYKKEIKNQLIAALDLSSYILQLVKKYIFPQQKEIFNMLLNLHDKMNKLYKIL